MQSRKKINYRFGLILSGFAVILGIAVHFTHRYQVQREARELLDEAAQLEQTGESFQAVDYLDQYLLIKPEDAAARARRGFLLNSLAKTWKQKQYAYFALNDALIRDPSRSDIRRVLVPLAISLGRTSDARTELAELRKSGIEDSDLMRQQARVEVAERNFSEAATWYRKAVQNAPNDPEISLEMAAFLRHRMNSPLDADLEIERLLKAAGDSPRVRLAAAQYYRQWGDFAKARHSITGSDGGALSDDADVLLLAAEIARAEGKIEDARRYLDRGTTRFPNESRFLCAMAELEFLVGNVAKSRAIALPLVADLNLPSEKLWQFGNLLIDLGETSRVEELLSRFAQNNPPSVADFLRARVQLQKGSWVEAQRLFHKAIAPVGASPPMELARQAHLFCALCYTQLGNPDGRVDACRKAIALDPMWIPAHEELAAALVALGQTEEAFREYRFLSTKSPAAGLVAVRLSLTRMLKLPPAERQWSELEEALKKVPDSFSHEVRMIRAEILFAQNKPDDAKTLILAERDRDPKQLGPWLFLIALAERGSNPNSATAVLDEAEKRVGPRAEWLIERVRLHLKLGGPELPAKIAALESAGGDLPEAERVRWRLALGEAFLKTGDTAGVERVWGGLAAARPNDPDIRFRLFGVAVQRGDEALAQRLIGELTRIEGSDGPFASFAEAILHMRRARQGDKSSIAAARQALAKASAARPFWSAVLFLEAELSEFLGDKANAIEKYQALVSTGRASIDAVRRLVQLLAGLGRHAEARAAIAKLPEQVATSGGFDKAAAQLTLRSAADLQGREAESARKQGLEEARKAVRAGSTEYRDYLWLGEMALLAGERAEAETAFRKARQLKESAPETWVALIVLLSRTDAKKAEAELEVAKAKIPADQLPQALAVCYEALGKLKEAGEQYLALSAGRPDDPIILLNLGAFQMRSGDSATAEKTLRRLLALGPKLTSEVAAWGRRSLAITLVSQGGFDRLKEAAALAEEVAGRPEATAEDRWIKALVLAVMPGRRLESIELLEKAPVSVSTSNVRFLLARLYDQDGRWQLAQRELEWLLRVDERNPLYLAYFARMLLKHDRASEAEPLIGRLVKATGETSDTVELNARLLKSKNRSGEAATAIKNYAAKKGTSLTLPAANLLDNLDLTADAETFYKLFAKESKEPTASLPLAGFLARHWRLPEALAICETSWKTCPPEAVAHACVAALRVAKAGETDAKRVEGWLDTAIAGKPQSTGLLVLKADLKQFRQQFPEAADLYRQILAREPKHLVALNNLAFLIAVKDGKPDEGLRLINAALDVTGPHAELLDTRGTVLTYAGRPDDAIDDLQRAIADSPSPVKRFHLAQAQLKAGRKDDAVRTYRDAIKEGLKVEDLHTLEKPEWDRLARELKP